MTFTRKAAGVVLAAVAALALSAGSTLAATPEKAAGTSAASASARTSPNGEVHPLAGRQTGTTNGCYGQWWNTAFNGFCGPATATGWYWVHATCAFPFGTVNTPATHRDSGYTDWLGGGSCATQTASAVEHFSGHKP